MLPPPLRYCQEVNELGDASVLENLNYILHEEAGSSELTFQVRPRAVVGVATAPA